MIGLHQLNQRQITSSVCYLSSVLFLSCRSSFILCPSIFPRSSVHRLHNSFSAKQHTHTHTASLSHRGGTEGGNDAAETGSRILSLHHLSKSVHPITGCTHQGLSSPSLWGGCGVEDWQVVGNTASVTSPTAMYDCVYFYLE